MLFLIQYICPAPMNDTSHIVALEQLEEFFLVVCSIHFDTCFKDFVHWLG